MRLPLKSKTVLWFVMAAGWLAQSLANRAPLDADAISYLDIAYRYAAGNWHALVNGYWSPGYPFLLTMVIKLFGVPPNREPLAIHLLAFGSLIGALLAFEYLLRTLLDVLEKSADESAEMHMGLSAGVIELLGYALFVWVSTFLTPPYLEQPDILVLIVYLLASALALQLVFSEAASWRFALFGAVLGVGYLIKAIMFPLSFVFLAVLLFRENRTRRVPAILFSVATFAVICSPFVIELSRSKGRLTCGDAGPVNYRHITGQDLEDALIAPSIFPSGQARPVAAPHIAEYVYKADLGTYPPWADPSFDYRGATARFSLSRQLNRIHVVLSYYFEIYVLQLGAMLAGWIAILLGGISRRLFVRRLLGLFPLWLPALAGLSIYALVRAEGRMLAGITIVLFLALLAAVRIEKRKAAARYVGNIAVAVFVVMVAQAIFRAGHAAVPLATANRFPD